MNDGSILIYIFLEDLALLWSFAWPPGAKAARAERERLATLARARKGRTMT